MRLTIEFNTKADLKKALENALAELCGGAPAAPEKPAPKPKDKPAKQEELDLGGGSATSELDDLLGGGDAAEEVTEDQMKDELRKVLANKGKDIVTKVLAKHGAQKVGDVAAEDRAKVLATCKAVLAAK